METIVTAQHSDFLSAMVLKDPGNEVPGVSEAAYEL